MIYSGMQSISELFEKLRFRKKLIGGVDERDVWRQLDRIQQAYRVAYEEQRTRFKTILEMNGIDPGLLDEDNPDYQ